MRVMFFSYFTLGIMLAVAADSGNNSVPAAVPEDHFLSAGT